jgi:hypothetical protein
MLSVKLKLACLKLSGARQFTHRQFFASLTYDNASRGMHSDGHVDQ